MLRFNSLRFREMGVLKEEATIDLDAIGGTLVAMVGGNGSGKSSIMEMLAGALFRRMPTRGSLSDLANDRSSFVEVTVTNGARHTIRHSPGGKAEVLVLDEAGAPVLASGKVSEFDAWRADAMPPSELFYSTLFAAQERRGILSYTDGELKALVLRVVGAEKLEALSKAARKRAAEAKGKLDVVEARLRDIGAVDIDAGEALVAAERARVEAAAAVVEAKREELARVEAEASALATLVNEEMARRAARERLVGLVGAAESGVLLLTTRIANNRGVTERAEAIRAAQARATELDAALALSRESLATARAEADAAVGRHKAARDARAAVDDALRQALDAARTAEEAFALVDAARADAAKLPEARDIVERLTAELADANARVDELHSIAASGAGGRIAGLRAGLADVMVARGDYVDVASRALETDDRVADKLVSQPADLAAARAEVKRILASAGDAAREVSRLEARKVAADVPDGRTEARAVVDRAAQAVGIAADAQTAATQAEERARLAVVELTEIANRLTAERRSLDADLALVERLAGAEARIAELEPQLATASADLAKLRAELADLGEPHQLPPGPDVGVARASVTWAERELGARHGDLRVVEDVLSRARDQAVKRAGLDTERMALTEDVADWTRLGDDLGRDGLQAILTDDAAVAWGEHTNRLLHECIGTRWTVQINTQRPDGDGRRMLEDMQIRVIDTERGRDGVGQTFSGGERALLNEALSLGLLAVSAREVGGHGCTIVRDETSAPLDPGMAKGYIAMLRKAAAIVGADKVLYVSHSPEVSDLADARIEVVDGQVRVAA